MRISFHEWEEDFLALGAVGASCADEVQVWSASMPNDPVCVKNISKCLSPDELERAVRFRIDEPRLEFLFGRSILKWLLGARLGIAPDKITLGYGSCGKPFLREPVMGGDVEFSISHSNGHFAIALSHGRRVGIDIERIQDDGDWLLMARQFYSSDETEAMLTLPAEQHSYAFFKAWTSKEALLKATGEGLSAGLSGVRVSVLPDCPPKLLDYHVIAGLCAQWTIHSVPVPTGMVGALVVEGVRREKVV